MRVDDTPNTELTITKLQELFERVKRYKLTVQRGDQTLQMTLVPREMF